MIEILVIVTIQNTICKLLLLHINKKVVPFYLPFKKTIIMYITNYSNLQLFQQTHLNKEEIITTLILDIHTILNALFM